MPVADEDELARLTNLVYSARRDDLRATRIVWHWEAQGFSTRLPPRPARVLIAAAGAGRESMVLAEGGYEVDAFEPNAALIAQWRSSATGGVGKIWRATFDDFAAGALDRTGPMREVAHRRYDAFVLSWAGLSHCLGSQKRRRLLAAAARVAPGGPLLVSYADGNGWRHGRAERLGRALARPLGALRGVSPSPLCSFRGFGALERVEDAEMQGHGAALNRTFVLDGRAHTCRYGVLLPE